MIQEGERETLSPLKMKMAYQRPSSPYFSVGIGKLGTGRWKEYKREIVETTGHERKE